MLKLFAENIYEVNICLKTDSTAMIERGADAGAAVPDMQSEMFLCR